MSASKAQRTKTAERRAQAVQLRIAGMDWENIAKACGYASRGAACTDVTRALEVATAEMSRNVDVLRHQELARLDRLQQAYWAAALKGDVDAARTVLGCIDRRVKLQRLEPATRHEVITLSALDAEIARLQAAHGELGGTDADLLEPSAAELGGL